MQQVCKMFGDAAKCIRNVANEVYELFQSLSTTCSIGPSEGVPRILVLDLRASISCIAEQANFSHRPGALGS